MSVTVWLCLFIISVLALIGCILAALYIEGYIK